jgi:hypothetical protein
MDCPSQEQASARRAPRRFHFTLKELLVATALVGGFLAAAVHGGALGAAIFLTCAGALLIGLGWWLRRRGILDAGVVLGILGLALFVLLPYRPFTVWDGRKAVGLTFVVVDAATGEPIPEARVRIRDLSPGADYPQLPVPPGEPGVEGQTDSTGSVVLVQRFRASGRDSPYEQTGQVRFVYGYWLQVSAEQHETVLRPLSELTGKSRDIEDPTPPPIRVELKRTTQPDSTAGAAAAERNDAPEE